jgi:hypothetical protein
LEDLSRLLKSKTSLDAFNYHPEKITDLAFGDARGDRFSVGILAECLKTFELQSGLAISPAKSSIFTAGPLMTFFSALTFNLTYQVFGYPIRLPEAESGSSPAPLIDRVAARTGNSLSYAGRVELLRSLIQGVECYWLMIFPLPSAR